MEIPFKIESTSVHIAVLVTQFIHQTSAAGMVGVVNSLLIILVSLSISSWFVYIPGTENNYDIILRQKIVKTFYVHIVTTAIIIQK